MKYILFILLLLQFEGLFAQQPRFDHLDMTDGLSQNNIFSLLVDETGYVWAGTLDGLNRFNGYTFDVFKPQLNVPSSIKGSIISEICTGENGDVWLIARNGGLNKFDRRSEQFVQFGDTLFPGINIRTCSDVLFVKGVLWLRNQRLIARFDPTLHSFSVYMHDAPISGICKDSEGTVMLYGDFGLAKLSWQQNEFKVESKLDVPVFRMSDQNEMVAVLEHAVVSLTSNSVIQDTLVLFSEISTIDISPESINSILKYENEIWIGGNFPLVRITKNDELLLAERFSYQTEQQFSFVGFSANHLQADKAGNIWIGTMKHGINHFNRAKNQFQYISWEFQSSKQNDIEPIRAICKTKNGELWLGFDREGVGRKLSNGTQEYYGKYYNKRGDEIPIKEVRSIFEDSHRNLWLCERGNLCNFNYQTDRFETVNIRFDWEWPYRCYSVKEFEPGLLTITCSNFIGIVNLRTGNMTTLPSSKNGVGIRSSIRDMVYDRYRNLWVASDANSILKIDYPSLNYQLITPEQHGLSDNKIYALCTRNDSLWIASNTGLNLFDIKQNRVVKSWFEEDGLSNNVVYSVHLYGNQLWMSTSHGLSRMDVRTGKISSFQRDGFFMDDACFFDGNGDVYYGGYIGAIYFNPEDIADLELNRVPQIESFFLQNRQLFPGDMVEGNVVLKDEISKTSDIKLSYKSNSFGIGFNSFPFDVPNNNEFRYRLRNLHEDWIYPEFSSRTATYTKLQPGNYLFQVGVNAGDANWSLPQELTISIRPPFWHRMWFKIGLIILIAGIILSIYRLRLEQVKRRNLMLKKQVEEQTAELITQNQQIKQISDKLHEADQSKLRFFTNISHEFRTPLTLILGHLETLQHATGGKPIISIRNNAVRLLRLVNQLIDFRKMEQDQLKLKVSEFDLIGFTNEIVDSFQGAAKSKSLNLIFKSGENEVKVWLDKDKMEKILYNLVSNAIKYTMPDNAVLVQVSKFENEIELVVSDSGIGISSQDLPHIFDRFYRSQNQNAVEGHGIGLALVKGLTDLQKGNVQVTSKMGEGTKFILKFKTGKAHFKDKDFGESTQYQQLFQETMHDKATLTIPSFGHKVLIVEDNEELAGYLQELLSPKFQIQLASNGLEGMKTLKTFMPDLIISDIMMPVMDGMEFCKNVKANIETSHVPFILLTAKSEIETRIDGFELGIDDYIEKPFNPKLFLTRIEALLQNRQKLKKSLVGFQFNGSDEQTMSETDHQFWKKINATILTELGNSKFNTEMLSQKLDMSRASLYRKFEGLSGISPGDYIRKVRLNSASNFLNDKSKTISQVAEEVGFQSISHFRKAFKDEFGKTPSVHRNGH